MLKKIFILFILASLSSISWSATFADTLYTVKAGDRLWKIAGSYDLKWQELAKYNKITQPNLIHPGQILRLPEKIYAFESKSIMIPSRDIEIPAIMVFPKASGNKKFPLVIMAHGHGSNKDESGLFKTLGERLAKNGIASIRMDFPGCGDSSEPFIQNNLTNMLLDTKATLDFAIQQPMIQSNAVGILGYSMGGRVAMLALSQDTRYRAVGLWSPVGTNESSSILDSMGGLEIYQQLNQVADKMGFVTITTPWNQKLDLGRQWFIDMDSSKPLDAISTFKGPVLVAYGDQDQVIPKEVDEAIIQSAKSSSRVTRFISIGSDHYFKPQGENVIRATTTFFEQAFK